MSTLLSLLLLACIATCTYGEVPAGFILDVSPNCKQDGASEAEIKITSDLDVRIETSCANGATVTDTLGGTKVETTVTVLYAYPPAVDDGSCYFERPSNDSKIYVVDMDLFWTSSSGSAAVSRESYRITCSLEDFGSKDASISHQSSPFAEEDITQMKGTEDQDSVITLTVKDVLDRDISGSIPLGKTVKLSASINDTNGKAGLVPVTCDAISNVNSSHTYRILAGGCGDGVIIPKTSGFTTSGLTTVSTFFHMFEIGESTSITFRCKFTACDNACDSNSCFKSRSKRSVIEDKAIEQDSPRDGSLVDERNVLIGYSPPVNMIAVPSPTAQLTHKSSLANLQQLTTENFALRVYVGLGILTTLAMVSLLLSLYICLKQGSYRRPTSVNEQMVKSVRPCNCTENVGIYKSKI